MCASHITPGLYVLVPSCFEQNSYGIALGLGLSHMTPYDFFLAAWVTERVTPLGPAMVLYGLCIYSGGETGYNEIFSFELKFTLKVKAP